MTIILATAAAVGWLVMKATTVRAELEAAAELLPRLKADILADRKDGALATASELRSHTASAKAAVDDPLWNIAVAIPWVGPNFSAASELARSADDVANLGLMPIVNVYDTLDWDRLLPGSKESNLEPIRSASSTVTSAANAIRLSTERLNAIDTGSLIPQIERPLTQARTELNSVRDALDVAADVTRLAPGMLGSDSPRKYLVLIQNNAEIRASGGIPGALAVLTADKGKLTLGTRSSAGALGTFVPPVQVDQEQTNAYSVRLGKYMQDVNLTPDFPTSASTAKTMWERGTGESVDGVISIDPVALGYILDATGPIQLTGDEVPGARTSLPKQLTGANVVKTLMSDVYTNITDPKAQDQYFATVSGEVFGALASGKSDPKKLIDGISKGAAERRIAIWSSHRDEQDKIANHTVSGSVSGPSVSPAQFGVYFNDGTGAKMDYYVKRSVQLVQVCPVDGYNQVKVRITSTNTAPADAATSLPAYVTGNGAFGVPPGQVQTNIVAYGPTQSQIESAVQDGKKVPFAANFHAKRPVGSVTSLLAPGQSTTIEFTFGKIVQHTDPELVVTPTTESVKNVALPTQQETCNSGQ
ncbi:DUF4012 domain-containing protein [Arthrobacter sp. M4]|nr:DUF4012 domain-containing protein [Arthrobacter sp. M4]MCA4133071.1 DUF4012 domain-containing protein [Arthrobacter sp. M4]